LRPHRISAPPTSCAADETATIQRKRPFTDLAPSPRLPAPLAQPSPVGYDTRAMAPKASPRSRGGGRTYLTWPPAERRRRAGRFNRTR
jgi:hypothetical protein